jgi:hypothetical protein
MLLGVLLLAIVCAACNVDVNVDVVMREDGSGVVTVTATADPDVVSQAPSLASDLRFDDVRAAGWTVEGPTPTPGGGLQVVLSHPFTTPAEGTAILAGINGPSGPLHAITLTRTRVKHTTTFSLAGTLQVAGGLDAFSDADLYAAVGATPYNAQIAAAGIEPAQAVTVHFRAKLPGTVQTSTATAGSASAATGLSWAAPLDGTVVDVATLATVKDPTNVWASPLARGARIAFAVWIVIAGGCILYVVMARRRRAALRALR